MRNFLFRRLRFLGFSLWAFALTVGGRIAALPAEAATPEPRFREAPATALDVLATEVDRIALLQAQLDAAEEEITNLRKVLDLLGPLPDHPNLFIPVSPDELAQRATPAATRLFHHAELAVALPLAATPVSLTDALPGYDTLASAIRLTGNFNDGIEALSIELSALAGPARAVTPVLAG